MDSYHKGHKLSLVIKVTKAVSCKIIEKLSGVCCNMQHRFIKFTFHNSATLQELCNYLKPYGPNAKRAACVQTIKRSSFIKNG